MSLFTLWNWAEIKLLGQFNVKLRSVNEPNTRGCNLGRKSRGQPLTGTAEGTSGYCPRGPGLESLLSIRGLKINEMNSEFNATLFIDNFSRNNGFTILLLAFLNL